MNRSKFGKYAKTLRVKADLSQGEVAKRIGLKNGQMVSNWERGACYPPIREMKTLAELYGVSLKAFFDRFSESHRADMWRKVSGG